ncbi:hypothetical protein Cgig2_028078 [Carnegiea gigantea]|uniref:Uncharacterized protein n=1 Tax=Carnegiea gigantea TaxID=171969 RepID=A0A9Q1KK68_9CARY|nr:hypothetical protein Cgig2_028078 [Carnegiea gigantea]
MGRKRKLQQNRVREGSHGRSWELSQFSFIVIVLQPLTVQAAMEGPSRSFGSPASNSRICCPKCKVTTELEYSVSRSKKNFLKPYYACLKCRGMGSHEHGSMNRGRQRVVGGPQDSVTIDLNDQLKEEVSCLKREIVEMTSEIRSLLGKIYDAIKILALL